MFAGRRVDDEVAALWLVLFLFSKQGGQGNPNEVRRWVVTGVEVDEVVAAEHQGSVSCKYGGCVGPRGDEVPALRGEGKTIYVGWQKYKYYLLSVCT